MKKIENQSTVYPKSVVVYDNCGIVDVNDLSSVKTISPKKTKLSDETEIIYCYDTYRYTHAEYIKVLQENQETIANAVSAILEMGLGGNA